MVEASNGSILYNFVIFHILVECGYFNVFIIQISKLNLVHILAQIHLLICSFVNQNEVTNLDNKLQKNIVCLLIYLDIMLLRVVWIWSVQRNGLDLLLTICRNLPKNL